jgi:hypothetical protein
MNEDFRPKRPIEQTPAEDAENQDIVQIESSVPSSGLENPSPVQRLLPAKIAHHHRRFKEWFGGLKKRDKILFVALVVAILAALGYGVAYALRSPAEPIVVSNSHKQAAPKPLTEASKLTGLQVDPKVNERQVVGVMIENSTFARPQSGLDQAGVVFEAEAEGGITRFLALYQDEQPKYLGPVRSARPYYVQWCQGFDCAYAHVGGSPEALSDIKKWDIKDLNQFAGGSYFERVGNRVAPHNVYTSLKKLNAFAKSRGYTKSDYSGFDRNEKDAAVTAEQTTATKVSIDYPGSSYDVTYKFDAKSKTYKRSIAGKAHTVVDASGTTTQLAPKVVIALAAGQSHNGKSSVYKVIGSGEVNIFQNGTVIHGTWSKPTAEDQITFADDNGAPLKLNPGQTWISVIGSLGKSSYK